MEGKVLPFKGKPVLFTQRQREGISTRLVDYTERPAEATNAVEDELCRQLVLTVREVATAIGENIGAWLAKKVFRSDQS